MNCYYHPDHDAVAQCADCGKGLCRSCATRFTIPICPECNGVRRRSELRGCIVPLLLCGLLFAIGYNSEFMGPDHLFGACGRWFESSHPDKLSMKEFSEN